MKHFEIDIKYFNPDNSKFIDIKLSIPAETFSNAAKGAVELADMIEVAGKSAGCVVKVEEVE